MYEEVTVQIQQKQTKNNLFIHNNPSLTEERFSYEKEPFWYLLNRFTNLEINTKKPLL